jgi:hypothetical protein
MAAPVGLRQVAGKAPRSKRPTAPKKRRAIEQKEREVDEARKRLLQAEASLAAEEIPELTKKE